jgi:CoA:oxalate CoA-transferase
MFRLLRTHKIPGGALTTETSIDELVAEAKARMSAPLDDVRVLDLSQALSGPFVARILADLGADVVKVEWPRGDVANRFGERIGGVSGLFHQVNAGKRGIAVDRTVPEGNELIRRLAARADVVIENFRPGVLDRAGLGYAELSAENPSLVMLSISGFGRGGPESDRRAYAPVVHAEAGILGRQADVDGDAPRDLVLALADTTTSLHGTIAVLAALRLRAATGCGQHIDLAMLDAMVATDDYMHAAIDGAEVFAARGQIFDAPGGPVLVAADTRSLWHKVATTQALTDPHPDGALEAKVAARMAAVADWISSFPNRDALLATLDEIGLAWGNVRTTETVLASPTLQARDVVATVDDHAGGTRGVIRMPYRFSAASCDVRGPGPSAGQHNREVLADWLGLLDDEINGLEAAHALNGPNE